MINYLCAITFVFFLSHQTSSATLYTGNGDGSGGGAVGNGNLTLTGNGATVFATFNKGGGSFNDVLVIFISAHSGGFTSTSSFSDHSGDLQRAISGVSANGSGRSTAIFANGFAADYAFAIGVNQNGAL